MTVPVREVANPWAQLDMPATVSRGTDYGSLQVHSNLSRVLVSCTLGGAPASAWAESGRRLSFDTGSGRVECSALSASGQVLDSGVTRVTAALTGVKWAPNRTQVVVSANSRSGAVLQLDRWSPQAGRWLRVGSKAAGQWWSTVSLGSKLSHKGATFRLRALGSGFFSHSTVEIWKAPAWLRSKKRR